MYGLYDVYRLPSTVCRLLIRRDVMNFLRLAIEVLHWPLLQHSDSHNIGGAYL